MSPNEIEAAVGKDALQAVEAAVSRAFAHAAAIDGADGGLAVREMLLSLLAATIITPSIGASDRASRDADRLIEIVAASLTASPPAN